MNALPSFRIEIDDLSSDGTRALLALHLAGMHEASPPEHVFALDLSGLKDAAVTVWSVREGDQVIGIGALKALDAQSGEVKSMRTHPAHLRRGVAAALLDHMIGVARARGWTKLSLETGRGAAFEPALELYRRRGFVVGAAFAEYRASAYCQFLHLGL